MYPVSSGLIIFINYLFAILFAQSVIVFVEVLINFKRAGALKKLLLLFAFNTAFLSFGRIYCSYIGYNRWLLEVPSMATAAIMLLFLSLLYQQKIKQYIRAYVLLLSIIQILVFLYFSFIFPIDASINLRDVEKGRILVMYLRFGYVVGMIIIIADLFFKIRKKYSFANIYHDEYRKWVTFLVINMFIMIIAGLFRTYSDYVSFISGVIMTFEFFIIMLAILFRPKFLNNSNLKISMSSIFNKSDNLEVSSEVFSDIFFNKLFYLESEASLDNLAKLLKINPDDLYRFIYNNYQSSFTDLVNQNRVNYFIDLVKSGKYANYTVDALAQKSGFSSRHHMFKPFKKFHGGNPSEFIRSVAQ
jgi:AraC-like DNA-binding protein